jgi:hypothetical protein
VIGGKLQALHHQYGAALNRFPTLIGKNKERVMKSTFFSKLLAASFALVFAGSAFAANASNKGDFQISSATQVNGKELPAGDYQARWEGTGPTVHLTITQGKKVVATVPAQIVDLDKVTRASETETKKNPNGDRELTALRFSGKKYSLELGSESAKAGNKTDSTD